MDYLEFILTFLGADYLAEKERKRNKRKVKNSDQILVSKKKEKMGLVLSSAIWQ